MLQGSPATNMILLKIANYTQGENCPICHFGVIVSWAEALSFLNEGNSTIPSTKNSHNCFPLTFMCKRRCEPKLEVVSYVSWLFHKFVSNTCINSKSAQLILCKYIVTCFDSNVWSCLYHKYNVPLNAHSDILYYSLCTC